MLPLLVTLAIVSGFSLNASGSLAILSADAGELVRKGAQAASDFIIQRIMSDGIVNKIAKN